MELKSETIELRDGSKITVTEANWPTDVKLAQLQKEAQDNPRSDPNRQFYAMAIYPKLVACSTGDIPTEEDAFLMPSVEHDKWYGAASTLNPRWFAPMESAASKINADELKKKEKKPTRSTKGS